METDKAAFCDKLMKSSAISMRCDGSVDRTQIDKIFVMAKVVHHGGAENLYFLGVDECPQRGAKGLLMAVRNACVNTVGKTVFNKLLLKTSSFVTEGTNCNTGEKGGLWTLVKQLHKDLAGDDEIIPQLLTIWCAVHRSNLAWEAVSASVQEIAHLFQELVAICSYFRRSGLRSRELRDIASQNNFNVMTLPKLFEIRWSEFTYQLINK